MEMHSMYSLPLLPFGFTGYKSIISGLLDNQVTSTMDAETQLELRRQQEREVRLLLNLILYFS